VFISKDQFDPCTNLCCFDSEKVALDKRLSLPKKKRECETREIIENREKSDYPFAIFDYFAPFAFSLSLIGFSAKAMMPRRACHLSRSIQKVALEGGSDEEIRDFHFARSVYFRPGARRRGRKAYDH
jgi:hypothetical protein